MGCWKQGLTRAGGFDSLRLCPMTARLTVATGRTCEFTPPEEVRVALAYLTAWPCEDGRLVFHHDLYGLDRSPRRQVPRVAPRRLQRSRRRRSLARPPPRMEARDGAKSDGSCLATPGDAHRTGAGRVGEARPCVAR